MIVIAANLQVVNRFEDLVEEGHPAHDALLKIFVRKIKRSKKKDAGAMLQDEHCLLHVSLWRTDCGREFD